MPHQTTLGHVPNEASIQSHSTRTCARCVELGILDTLSHRGARTDLGVWNTKLSSVITQRLLFDFFKPLIPDCDACSKLVEESSHWIVLRPSRVYHHGVLEYGAARLLAMSEFTLHCREAKQSGFRLVRSTQPWDNDHNLFKNPIIVNNSHVGWEHETFGAVGPLTILGTVQQVDAHPDYAAISAWLAHCTTSHQSCRPKYSESLESISLINVYDWRVVPYPKETSEPCEYVVLSYVWGKARQPLVPKSGRLPNELPQTINDSMTVVKKLGKRYLWVDSICINQRNQQHKMSQIAIMDAIYLGAFATIVSLCGDSANSGLPGVSSASARIPQLIVEFAKGNLMAEKFPSLGAHLDKGIWSSRGWTYQEGLLSRRRIIFTTHQVYYCCNQMECCETLDDENFFGPSSSNRPGQANQSLSIKDPLLYPSSLSSTSRIGITLFERLVDNYVRRKLSRDDDALHAISALLGYLQPSYFPDGFLYGLPIADFRQSLLWYQASDDYPENTYHGELQDTTSRVCSYLPSWSWARWKLVLKFQLPSLGRSPITPPLSIYGSHGCCLFDNVSEFRISLESREASEESTSRSREQDVDKEIEWSYKRLLMHNWSISRQAYFSQNRRSGDWLLQIQGIVLHLPCNLSCCGGLLRLPATRHYKPDFSMCLPVDSVCVEAHLDGQYERFGRPLKRGRMQDFLLLHADTSTRYVLGDELVLDLLLLYWENGIAMRGGTVTAIVNIDEAMKFWKEARPRFLSFWLG